MKKLSVLITSVFLVLLLSLPAASTPRTYFKNLTTGGSTNALDGVDGDDLSDGDRAIVKGKHYSVDADHNGVEQDPYIISPDSNAGTKRWVIDVDIGAVYYVDPSETDIGIAGDGSSLKDIIDAIGSSKKVTIVFMHTGASNTTDYVVSTSETASDNFYFIFEPGAVIKPDSAKALTVASPEHIKAGRRQQIVDLTNNSTSPLLFTAPGTRYVHWWGAKGDGGTTDNVEEFQAAIESVQGGVVYVPEGDSYYSYSAAIRMKDEVTLFLESTNTSMYADTSGEKWPLSASVLFGSYQENNRENLDDDDYALNAVSKADESVTTTTAGHATNFSVGDVIWIHSTTEFTISGKDFYTWGQINVVVTATAGTGVITLRHPMAESGAAVIANLSDNGDDFLYSDDSDTGYDNFATRDARIIGGTWENANTSGSFTAAGGATDCIIDIHRSKAVNSPSWGNMFGHSTFKAKQVHTFRRVYELAMHSHNNIVEYDTVYCDASGSAATALLYFGEASRDNILRINKIVTDADDETLLRFNETRNNLVEISRVEAPAITNSVVMFRTTTLTGTAPNCEGNKVRILTSNTTNALSNYIVFDGDQTFRNMVYDSNFFGILTTSPNGAAVNLNTTQADSHNSVRDSYFEDGRISMAVTATGYILSNNYLQEGIITVIDTGVIPAANNAYMRINTEASAASDDLDTIDGGVIGSTLILYANDTDDTVVCKHGTGNLILAGSADFSLDNAEDMISLFFDGTNWLEISRSAN